MKAMKSKPNPCRRNWGAHASRVLPTASRRRPRYSISFPPPGERNDVDKVGGGTPPTTRQRRMLPISYGIDSAKIIAAQTLIVMAMVMVCSLNSFAQSTNVPTKLSYDSFRTIGDRNIFNPNRYARGSGRTNTRASSTPASRVESFTLVGIMAYEKGSFAFFDGTKSDYKHALQADGVIGEFKLVHVMSDAVKIIGGTNSFDLKVGMQMRREDEGEWFLSEGGDAPRKRIVSTRTRTRGGSQGDNTTVANNDAVAGVSEPEVIVVESDTQSEAATSEASSSNGDATVQPQPESDNGGVADPVLLRLMQRRQQMNQ